MRRRNFSEGPGSYEFPTKYGSYRVDYVDGIKTIKHVNLIEEMRGKCSIFRNEPRIAKCSFEACLFNLLNDLFYFVDVPGYGYASVSKKEQKKFGLMIEEYLEKRENLKNI